MESPWQENGHRPFLLYSSHIAMRTFVFIVYVVFQQYNQRFCFLRQQRQFKTISMIETTFSVLRPIWDNSNARYGFIPEGGISERSASCLRADYQLSPSRLPVVSERTVRRLRADCSSFRLPSVGSMGVLPLTAFNSIIFLLFYLFTFLPHQKFVPLQPIC